jgi:exodeoxyribonuclease V gamma subunit
MRPMTRNDNGLIVHRASRTERLAEELAAGLEAARPRNPLATQTVVVAHPGLRRWLLGEFARRPGARGGHGIAANFDMILPWQWLERAARYSLGDAALIGGAYRHELLRWQIFTALPAIDTPQIATYLDGEDSERRRFQLAEHLAGVFTQYLIYRPEWILGWERGAHADDWQAALWQKVRSAIGLPHRAQRRDALLAALAAHGDGEHLPLHIFGVSHLAPDILAALRALAARRTVHLYFPDPCREHWVYLRDHRALLKMADDPQALYFEVGHPLLASLGRIAQDFCLALDDEKAIDVRDALDDADPSSLPSSLMARVQLSIRCCEPDWVGAAFLENVENSASSEPALLALRDDASLRVHACHTRLRELEVLKDALLRSLADDATLTHRDIVVMAPDIAAYAPYLAAVFGEPARYDTDPVHIPWHLADVGLARAHPLMSAFVRVLDLAESRFAVSEVLDFLDVPAVARRFGIDAEDRLALERWLRRARVAWGLDAAMKAQAGAAALEANSWKFGFDRLYAGLIVGEETPAQLLDGILPVAGVSGNAVEALGGLDRLLSVLRRARAGFGAARPLAAWSDWLLDLIDTLYQVDAHNDAEIAAFDTLRRLVAALAEQADAAGRDTALSWSVVREALRGALESVAERQPFLLGGVTFCGLVPQRSIPFRVVGLLGMNEGEFPRVGGDAGLNRMLVKPRRGDRDTRSEDRYLFLEALMAARERLHISYIGEGVRDGKPCNPASPLAELLQFLDEQHGLVDDDELPRPWLIRHPLQPFDARYYHHGDDASRHDPRLFSYDQTYADLPASVERSAPSFFDSASASASTYSKQETGNEVPLAALARFWRDPAKYTLLHDAGLSLDALDDEAWPDREPLEAKPDRRERIERRLLFDALATAQASLPDTPPDWLARSGVLAAGAVGELVYAQARDQAQAVLDGVREILGKRPERAAQAIDLDLGDDLRLTGVIERVYRTADGALHLFDAKPGGIAEFRELLPFYLDWAVLRLTLGQGVRADFVEYAEKSTLRARRPGLLDAVLDQDPAQLREGLLRLIRAARSQPLLFFPKTAWAWATAQAGKRDVAARKAWESDDFTHTGERDYAPGYAALLARGQDLFDGQSSAHARFVAATELVADVLDPQRRVLLRDDASTPAKKTRKRKP